MSEQGTASAMAYRDVLSNMIRPYFLIKCIQAINFLTAAVSHRV